MNTEMMPIDEMLPILVREGRRRVLSLIAIFAALALIALGIGLFLLPKTYQSTTTIHGQERGVIEPLMEGRTTPTGTQDRASMARQVLLTRSSLQDVLEAGGWLADDPSPVEQDRLMEEVRNNTTITSPREGLIEITYRDSEPERAYRVASRFADLFIAKSHASKEQESREAYEFINSQVEAYHRKLTEAEANLQQYRSANADAQPGSAADVNSRIGSLRTQVEQTRMALLELQSREQALQSQLSGESEITGVQTRESLYRAQLAELQAQLDRLLLTYTEQYPDVIRTRHQIADITRQLEREEARDNTGAASPFDNTQYNPFYQELKGQLAQVRQEIAATQSRMGIAESLLAAELDRSRRIAASESVLAELTRDYEVNRDLYQDLLRRREDARLSMVMDEERRGLTFRIQEPATMPLRPTGLRTLHVVGAGFAAALAAPGLLLFAIVRFDPRIRSVRQMERMAGVPVLASVPHYLTPRDRMRRRFRALLAVLIAFGVFAAYGAAYWMKTLELS